MKIPLLALVFQGIPEQIAIITLACVLVKAELVWDSVKILWVLKIKVISCLPATLSIPH